MYIKEEYQEQINLTTNVELALTMSLTDSNTELIHKKREIADEICTGEE